MAGQKYGKIGSIEKRAGLFIETQVNEAWTVNLIEHLCKCDDELNQFRKL